ncbi:MAG TPA: hypothetical protein VMV56_04925 [Williamwhitmania sp.]|nr:hypothetical protein [Williamwhitmania sp.]
MQVTIHAPQPPKGVKTRSFSKTIRHNNERGLCPLSTFHTLGIGNYSVAVKLFMVVNFIGISRRIDAIHVLQGQHHCPDNIDLL